MEKKRERRSRQQLERMAARPPVMTILSDGPLSRDDWKTVSFFSEDRLGAVFDILRHANTTTPMAVALYGTQVTEAGVRELKEALPECEIRH